MFIKPILSFVNKTPSLLIIKAKICTASQKVKYSTHLKVSFVSVKKSVFDLKLVQIWESYLFALY